MYITKQTDKLLKGLSRKREFYEQVAEDKGDADDYWSSGFYQSLLIKKINGILEEVHHQQIIDIGCGDGRTALYLAKGENTIIGVDISYKRLSRAKQKTRPYARNSLFLQAYAETLPIKKEIFDGAICTEVLEHVVDDDALLRELAWVVKQNAWILISIPTVSLRRYVEMLHIKRPIYCDSDEHLREFTHYRIPWFDNNFIMVKALRKKFKVLQLHVMKCHRIGLELPLWVTKFKFVKLLEKYFQNKNIHKFFTILPILKNFSVYTIFVLRKGA